VHPGNQDYLQGDRIPRQNGGSGGGGGSGQQRRRRTGRFHRTDPRRIHALLLRGPELPRLVETNLLQVPNWKNQRAGYSVDGTPNNIDVVRSLRPRWAAASPWAGRCSASSTWPRKPGRDEAQTRGAQRRHPALEEK
jgi:uncharacterized sporulation protein YeaH/YhbH (DUF444 family)